LLLLICFYEYILSLVTLSNNFIIAFVKSEQHSVPTTSCLGKKADIDMGGLMLSTCNVTEGRSGYFEVVPTETHRVNIVMKNSKVDSKKSCLVAQPLRNNGGKFYMR